MEGGELGLQVCWLSEVCTIETKNFTNSFPCHPMLFLCNICYWFGLCGGCMLQFYTIETSVPPPHPPPLSTDPLTPFPYLKKFIKICEGTLELLAYSKLDFFLFKKKPKKVGQSESHYK
jgi:hypothetical protein